MRRILAFTVAALTLLAALPASLMAFWHRKPPEPGGEWTGPFKPGEWRAFVGLVREYFERRGQRIEVQDGYVVVGEDEGGGRYGLENVSQVCAGHDRREWPAIIARHFDALHRAEAQARPGGAGRSFEEAKPLLALRLWPEAFLAQVGPEHAIYRQDLPGTLTVLVFDLPETVQQVQPAEAAGWGKSTDELFAVGLDNLRRKPRPQVQRAPLPDGTKVTVLSGSSFFVASEALRLDQFPGCTGRGGALVGVPTRHILVAYPVEDAGVLPAMQLLVPIIIGMFSKGPGSVSPRLYWYREGTFTDMPYTIEGTKVRLSPPDAFVEWLRGTVGGG